MGCNCAKNRAGQTVRSATTVYQVIHEGTVESEHGSLPEARSQAMKVGGRVKVTSKTG